MVLLGFELGFQLFVELVAVWARVSDTESMVVTAAALAWAILEFQVEWILVSVWASTAE